jgi:hypothetical protein
MTKIAEAADLRKELGAGLPQGVRPSPALLPAGADQRGQQRPDDTDERTGKGKERSGHQYSSPDLTDVIHPVR